MDIYSTVRFNITCQVTGASQSVDVVEGSRMYSDLEGMVKVVARRAGFTKYSVARDIVRTALTKVLY